LPHFAKAVEVRYVLEHRAAVDAMAGLVLTQQLMGLDDEASASHRRLQAFAQELNERNYLAVAESCRVRLLVLQGDLGRTAGGDASVDEPSSAKELFSWLEAPSITRARVMIAEGTAASLGKATELLTAVRQLSEACRFTSQTIEAAVLQALTLERQGRTGEALDALREAVDLAKPGGWMRPFVELGPALAGMLERLLEEGEEDGFIGRVLTALESGEFAATLGASAARGSEPLSASGQSAPDALTHRELDVLELLAQRLPNKEIAGRLFISTHTVNDHLKRIYQKLAVNTRQEAVNRVLEAGLLKRHSS
jgi:LuxR family maltose regulon positive regulatory protein